MCLKGSRPAAALFEEAAPVSQTVFCQSALHLTKRCVTLSTPPPLLVSLSRSYISDITTSQCRQLLKKEAAGSLFDVVLHDGAPNVGGAWTSEAYTQVSPTGGG